MTEEELERKRGDDRYNRRTRAIEEQAHALSRIADALELQAIAAVAATHPATTTGSRAWRSEYASELMGKLSQRVKRL